MKRILTPILKIAVSALLVGFLLKRIGVEPLVRELAHANPVGLLLALLCFTASTVLGAFQWHLLLRARSVHFPFLRTLGYYYVGLFFNNFLIGYVGGDAFRIYDAARASGNATAAASAVLFDRLLGFVVLTSLALVASVVWLQQFALGKMALVAVVILVVWATAVAVLFEERIARAVAPLVTFLLPVRLHTRARDLYRELNAFRHQKKALARILVVSVFVQFLRVVTHYFAGLAVGVHVSLVYFLVFIPIVALMASLPVTFGGIGMREQTGVALFSQIGLPPSSVTAMEFLAYLVGVLSSLPGGVYFLLRREQFRAATDAAAS